VTYIRIRTLILYYFRLFSPLLFFFLSFYLFSSFLPCYFLFHYSFILLIIPIYFNQKKSVKIASIYSHPNQNAFFLILLCIWVLLKEYINLCLDFIRLYARLLWKKWSWIKNLQFIQFIMYGLCIFPLV